MDRAYTHVSLHSNPSLSFHRIALGADPPHRRLRIGLAGSGSGGMAFNSRRQEMDFSFTEVRPTDRQG